MLFQDSIRIKFHIWRVTKIDYGVNTGRTPHAGIAQRLVHQFAILGMTVRFCLFARKIIAVLV